MNTVRLAMTYAAVASLAAAGYLASNGETAAPAALSGVALLAVVGRFGIDPELRELVASAAPSLPRRERIAGPIVAALLVTAALGAPLGGMSPVQPAAATHDCSTTERLVTFSFGLTGYAGDKLLNDGKCTESHRAQAIKDMQESDANQTKTDIYNAGLQQQAESETRTAVYSNYLNDTESAAWMQAEMAVAQAYKNGSSESVAKSKARAAIADYYSVKQENLIQNWNTDLAAVMVLRDIARNETGINKEYVDIDGKDGNAGGTIYTPKLAKENLTETTYTLQNGSTATVKVVHVNFYDSNGQTAANPGEVTISLKDGKYVYSGFDNQDPEVYGLRVNPPTSDYEKARIVTFEKYEQRYQRIGNQSDALQSEVDVFVNNTWEAYQSGKINASDVLSRNTQMFRYGNAALNGSESTYEVTAALSSMGLESPELNGTGTMLVNYNGADYYGMVLARNAPNGSWQAGTTYNTSNFSGPVLLATTSGTTYEMSGEFTVKGITSETGENISEVRTTKIVYKTSNTTELLAKMEGILRLREEIESRQVTASGGGTTTDGGTGLLEKLAALLGISAGAAAAVLAAAGLLVLKIYAPSN